MAAPKLYTMLAGMPRKYIFMYRTDSGRISSGVPINTSIGSHRLRPIAMTISPLMTLTRSEVCTERLMSSGLLAPYSCATITLVPTDRPMKKFTMRLIREPVAPTAASASLPENCPATTMSAALNRSCRRFIAMMGSAKIRMFLNSGPLHMSMDWASRF